jgi:hypothetical protein
MKHLKINNNEVIYPYDINNLSKDYPNTSFPENISNNVLIDYDIYSVNMVEVPFDYTKNYTEDIPTLIDGQYYQNWIITDATSEEIGQRINGQWNVVRSIRNEYLKESDWTQLPDSPLTVEKKQEWVTYRQELRDVTLQPDPFNITWPIKPS